MDEESARKKMTTYEVHTIRKCSPRDSREKATWARAEMTKEHIAQEDIPKAVKKLNELTDSVQDKKAALMKFQQGQINKLLDELIGGERDNNFEWSLAQLDSKMIKNKQGQKETTTITVYVKRAPRKDLDPIQLFKDYERAKAQFTKLPQIPSQLPPQSFQQNGGGGGGSGGGPVFFNVGQGQGRVGGEHGNQGGLPKGIINVTGAQGKPPKAYPMSRPKPSETKKYNAASSTESSSSYSSDTEDDSDDYSTDTSTAPSSRKKLSRRGSHSRREHRKSYYVNEQAISPSSGRRDSRPYGPQTRLVVPEPPRVASVPGIDTITAAAYYQAGKIDADAERLAESIPRRLSLVDPPRPVVSYGRQEPRYETLYEPRDGRYEIRESRYSPRRISEYRYEDLREDDRLREDRYREDRWRDDSHRRREREAEEYMDIASEPLSPRIVYRNPFTRDVWHSREPLPRRYAPSHTSIY
jgi:hypothetical protein